MYPRTNMDFIESIVIVGINLKAQFLFPRHLSKLCGDTAQKT